MNPYLCSFFRELNKLTKEIKIENIKKKEINNTTFNRNQSMDNFMKFQWAWTL